MAPMLDRQAKKHGDRKLSYYSLECYRNGKASGAPQHRAPRCHHPRPPPAPCAALIVCRWARHRGPTGAYPV
eukprot:scaffold23195_cov113-Isochrysis_galbana.AAC.5